MKVSKAVIPITGFGTRFLPASKAVPKEMATVVDRPVIDYVVQEAVNAGIKQIIFVTHKAKTSIEDYFEPNCELEQKLAQSGKLELLEQIRNIVPKDVSIVAIRQGGILGLGHAVLCAKPIIGEQPFAVLLPDVLVPQEKANDLQLMLQQFSHTKLSQIMVTQVAPQLVDQYGIVGLADNNLAKGAISLIKSIVEKPAVEQAKSNLAVVGRYIFSAQIFACLNQVAADINGEIQLTNAIALLMQQQQVQAYVMHNQSFDCGSKSGYLSAVMHYAARHPQLQSVFNQLVLQYASRN